MKIRNSTAKKIALDLVVEQIVCSLSNISDNLGYGLDAQEGYTEKQKEAIMIQAEKIALRSLIKIDPSWKGYRINW
tara:strand:+ start:704 stop:931 length:228 start_codon:yes stop_codon:yes gene_type:complete